MKTKIIFVFALIIIATATAQTSIESQLNYFSNQNNLNIIFSLENKSQEIYVSLHGNSLRIEKEGKTIALDLDSFKENKEVINNLDQNFKPDKIIANADDNPKIIFQNEKEIFSIKQTEVGVTKVFFARQADINETLPSVFIVEHYEPEKELTDSTRKKGKSRLVIITMNNPLVEINNRDLSVIPETVSVSTKSFFSSELDKSQIDVLSEDKATEIVGFADTILIRISLFNFNNLFDRGYSTEDINKISEEKIRGFDVTPDLCSKLGFAFLPGYGYDSVKMTDEFTKHKGWVLGIAYSKENNFNTSLDDMTLFLKKAHDYNLIPIIRVDGEKIDAALASDFINKIYNLTEGKLDYVQLWDKPNSREINPEEYAAFVIDVKKRIQPNIKIVSAALFPEKKSQEYLRLLIDYPGLIDNIDYLGAYAYNMSSYNISLELIKEETGKRFEVIITEAGYPPKEENFWRTHQLLQSFKEDKNVKAALIYSANSWKESPEKAWFNEDSTMKEFTEKVSSEICS